MTTRIGKIIAKHAVFVAVFFATLFSSSFVDAAPLDLTGDNRSDILYVDSVGAINVVVINGTVPGAPVSILGGNSGWRLTHTGDLNGDGKTDLLVENSDGRIAAMIMNGAAVQSFATVVGPNSGWQLTHVADLDGDGKADLLLQNTDGRVAAMVMNGSTVQAFANITNPGSGYRVTHTADLNGDGKADLVLSHSDGSIVLLLMNGSIGIAASYLVDAGSPWRVTHAADFNGDGKADLVIGNNDGSAAILTMNGTAVSQASLLLTAGSAWTVTHTGEVNGDKKADLFLVHADGSVVILLMNGSAVTNASYLLTANTPYIVAQTGDYNGDGKTDVVLQHSDGSALIATLSGNASGTVVTSFVSLWGASVGASRRELAPVNGQSANSVVLPLEVLGAEGIEVSVVLRLAVDQARLGQRLLLQTHNVRYPEKASLRINGGAWIALNNTTAQMIGTSQTYGGIGGSLATLKMSLPIASGVLRTGDNSLTFRFNVSNGISVGYRVLAINILDGSGQKLIPATAFKQSEPATWTPPSTQAADVAAGKTLWETAALKAHFEPAAALVARCSDCHTKTGADLKYFGYSNKAIVERAKFHGLTEAQGNQIASYIRSLPVKAVGRPWNPPYQPGPGLTAKANDEWAAGAGIQNVLDDDWDTIKAIFPTGIKREALIEGDTNQFKRFSTHDTPLAFQLPDWNHWLPEVHPYDAFGKVWFESTNNFKLYKKAREQFQGKTAEQIRQLFQDGPGYRAFAGWNGHGTNDGGGNGVEEAVDAFFASSLNQNSRITDLNQAQKLYSLALWKMVKHFELNEEFQLTGMGPETTGIPWAFDSTYALPRMWVGSNRAVFDTSPFLSALEGGVTGSASGNNDFNYEYLSNSWYQLQLILNAGQRTAGGHSVIDWPYSYGFLSSMDRSSNFSQAGRNALWAIKGMEECDNGRGANIPDGWSFTRAQLDDSMGLANTPDLSASPFWVIQPNAEARAVHSLLRQVWLEKNASWLPIQITTDLGTGQLKNKEGNDPNFGSPSYVLGSNPSIYFVSAAEKTNKIMPDYVAHRTYPAALQNGYAAWAQAIWPGVDANGVARNNWLIYTVPRVGTAPATPTVISGGTADTVTIGWPTPSSGSTYNVKRADSPNGPFLTIAYFRAGTSYTEKVPLPGRTYYYRVSKNTDQGESPDSGSAAIAR